MRTGAMGVKVIACVIAIVAIGSAQDAKGGVYPTNTCVSAKMAGAGAYCHSALKAWSKWDKLQNNDIRDAALATAVTNLQNAWMKAEAKALGKGVDCVDTTLSGTELRSMADGAVTTLVTQINGPLNLGDGQQSKCGSKLLAAAAKKCAAMLKAESKYMKALAKDPSGTARGTAKAAATKAFSDAWDKATAGTCPTTPTEETDVETTIDNLSDQVVTQTTVSPNVDDSQFSTITATGAVLYLKKWLRPVCMDNSPYAFFVKRGSVNKLLMYYQGGGACWDQVTCGGTVYTPAVCDTTVNTSGSDNPNDPDNHYGFGDLSNPLNPFKDWNIVFVSYCSCDIHYGDAEQVYNPTYPFPGGTPVHVVHPWLPQRQGGREMGARALRQPGDGLRDRLQRGILRRTLQRAVAPESLAGVPVPRPRRCGERRNHDGLSDERIPQLELQCEPAHGHSRNNRVVLQR